MVTPFGMKPGKLTQTQISKLLVKRRGRPKEIGARRPSSDQASFITGVSTTSTAASLKRPCLRSRQGRYINIAAPMTTQRAMVLCFSFRQQVGKPFRMGPMTYGGRAGTPLHQEALAPSRMIEQPALQAEAPALLAEALRS